jgi:hypothetical protein
VALFDRVLDPDLPDVGLVKPGGKEPSRSIAIGVVGASSLASTPPN